MAARKAREADPMTQLAALRTSVERDGLKRGYLLRGEEPWFRTRAEEAVRARASNEGHELCVHEAKDPDFSLASLLDDLSGGGLFASRRCVVVRNAGAILREKGAADGPLVRALKAFLASEDDLGCVVVNVDSLRADHALAKAIKAADGVLLSSRRLWDSPPPWDPDPRKVELVQWVQARAREIGVTLDANRATYLAAAVGNDLARLEDKLEQVRHAGGKDLREVVGWDASGSPFQLAEQLCRGDSARALSGVEGLFRGGFREKDGSRVTDSSGLVAILLGSCMRLVRQNLAGAAALEGGATVEEAAERAGAGKNPMARKSFAGMVELRRTGAWRGMLGELLELERRFKTGGQVDENDFALLAARWGTRGGPARLRR